MPAFARDGATLHYEVKGSGPPLMLVAGLAADSAFWAPSLDALAQRYTVILPDNRGSGRSTPLDAPGSIARMADDCMALATQLGHGSLSMAGHSMGGMIVQHCAARHPERIERAILASTVPFASRRDNDLFATWAKLFTTVDRALWFRNLFCWVLSPAFFAQPRSLEALVQLAAAYPHQQAPQSLTNQVHAIASFDARGELASIRARTLVMAGTQDLVFPIGGAAALAKAIPRVVFAPIDGAAHSFPIESPREFTQRVLDFLG